MQEINKYLDQAIDLIVQYGGRVVLAIVVLILGLAIIKRIGRSVTRTMTKRNLDPSLRPFIGSMLNALMKIMLVISIASMVGIEMTSFIAILGAAGLAVGLALQGSLSNFAGGVLILTLKPFKVGDLIEFNGKTGFVREIQIFVTIIETFEHVVHIIPNAPISSGTLTNFSDMPTKRQDWVFGISYGASIDTAKETLMAIAKADTSIEQDPAPQLFVSELADSSVNITLRVWVKNEDAPAGSTIIAEKVKKAFDAAGVGIPFPQLDLHLVEDKTKKQPI
jgi:small conductance mechanosensitive channel